MLIRARATVLALGTLAALGATAPPAGADPITITLDRASVQLNNGALTAESEGDSVLTGEIDTATGGLTFDETGVELPDFASGPTTIFTEAAGPFTGAVNAGTGQLTLNGAADVHVPVNPADPNDRCTFPGVPLSLSTENQSPFAGIRFLTGLDGSGAVVGAWSGLPPVQGTNALCPQVETFVDGPGGVVLETLFLEATVSPRFARVRRGKSKEFRVVVTPPVGPPGPRTTVCATVPRGLRIIGESCRTRSEILTFRFEVRAKRTAATRRYTLGFEASAPGHKSASASAVLKVTR